MKPDLRTAALRRFAAAITALNVVGRLVLGFESSWSQLLVAAGTAYAVEAILELVDAWAVGRPVQFLRGGTSSLVDFFLPAHITGLACSMLIYPNERLWPMAFASAVGVASKALLRAPAKGGARHFMNPSNTGIASTLLLFPWVGVAQPYQFTENVTGAWDWAVPGIIVCLGTLLNARLTKKLPLIAGWLGGFALQAIARSFSFGTPLMAALAPMTGLAFLLFTFYMVTDPATTPVPRWRQVGFGAAVAAAYGVLQVAHVVYGLFFALFAVCLARGAYLHWHAFQRAQVASRAPDQSADETAEQVVTAQAAKG